MISCIMMMMMMMIMMMIVIIIIIIIAIGSHNISIFTVMFYEHSFHMRLTIIEPYGQLVHNCRHQRGQRESVQGCGV